MAEEGNKNTVTKNAAEEYVLSNIYKETMRLAAAVELADKADIETSNSNLYGHLHFLLHWQSAKPRETFAITKIRVLYMLGSLWKEQPPRNPFRKAAADDVPKQEASKRWEKDMEIYRGLLEWAELQCANVPKLECKTAAELKKAPAAAG
jgi:hypothetical protein